MIKDEQEYEKTLERIDELFSITSESPEWDEFINLVNLVEEYENIYYPLT